MPLQKDIKHPYEVCGCELGIHAQLMFCNIKNQMLYLIEQTNSRSNLAPDLILGHIRPN
jgi:hypothetical protein